MIKLNISRRMRITLARVSGLILIILSLIWLTGSVGRAATMVFYAGVNLSGAEFGAAPIGTYGVDYIYPTSAEVDYFMGKGMNTFRLPFMWERLQHAQFDAFNAAELARLDTFVNYATGQGAYVIIEPHNFARYFGNVIGTPAVPATAFADFWSKLSIHFKNNPRVIFNLVNEPNDMSTELWRDDANAAIAAIRAGGATNLILVPGNAWTGAWSWEQNWYGTPNAQVMLGIVDPGNNYAIEVHQYLDTDASGTSANCVSTTIGSERLEVFTQWLQDNNRRGFLGEFAGGRNATCYAAMDDLLTYVDQHADVWLGWTYWSAGPWWEEYMFTLEPSNGVDRPQMAVLSQFLPPTPPILLPPTPPTLYLPLIMKP